MDEGISTGVSYPLAARVDYMRRHNLPGMLFSLAQKALREPEAVWEQVHITLTGDGDYKAIVVADAGDMPAEAVER